MSSHPDRRAGDGEPDPADETFDLRLAEARIALYRPGADARARAVFEELRARAVLDSIADEAADPSGGRGQGPGSPTRRRFVVPVLLLVPVLAGLVVLVLPAAPSLKSSTSPSAVSSSLPLAAALEQDPGLLPSRWRSATVEASRDDLDGARTLRGSGSVLLVVRCPASDRSFQVATAGSRTRYGACGRLQTFELADATSVLVTTRGVLPFSAALLSAPGAS